MLQKFCNWLLFKKMGWISDITVVHPDKYIICLAPHTSNWDFVIGQLFARATGLQAQFLMKKEWFVGPLGVFFRKLGGIPVWRSKHTSMTDILAEQAKVAKTFHLCVTPEGTRSLNAEWKKGFYFIALKAEIPILLYGLDFEKKCISCTRSVVPTGDIEKDMKEIKSYFKTFVGKKPWLFTTGEI